MAKSGISTVSQNRANLTYTLSDFLVRNSTSNNFHLKLFLKKYVFLVALSPKWNVICSFNNKYNNHINLLRPLAPLCGETYAVADLFVQNLTLNNYYLKRLFLPLPFSVCSIFFTWQWREIMVTPTCLQQ